MKKINLSVISILIGSMAFPAWAAEDIKAVPPRVYGQPVANVPVAIQPVVGIPLAVQPVTNIPTAVQAVVSVPVVATQPATNIPATMQPVASVPGSPSVQTSQQTALNKARLTFMDSKLFDVRLGKELESGKDTVEVDVSGRVPLSNIPARIDRWVVKSAEEGKVELLQSEQAPKTRFIFSLIPMVFNAIGFMKDMQEEKMFDQAKKYDTKIYYKKDESGETLIEKVVMTKRKP